MDPQERKKFLTTPMVSENLVALLQSVGIRCLTDLQGKTAESLITAINEKSGYRALGGPLDTQALTNLLDKSVP